MMMATKFEGTRVYREAQEEVKLEIALKLLRENLELEMIAEVTGLSIEQLQALQAQNS
jgi:predicted transposase/invertase (TIGR01784 family)